MGGTRLLKWLLIPLAIVSVLTLARDGGGITLQDYLNMVVKLLDSTLGVVLETIFREPLQWLIARINEVFQLNLFLQDHWKPAFFLMWLVFNNYVLATWNAATGWPRLGLAFVCALSGGVMAATVNLAHPSVFLWPACFSFVFIAVAVERVGWLRAYYLFIASLFVLMASGLHPTNYAHSGLSASHGLLLVTIAVFVASLWFLVRGSGGHKIASGDWWNDPVRRMGGYILLILFGAATLLGVSDWIGPMFRTAQTRVIAETPIRIVQDCQEVACPEMIAVPAGSFDMGADDAETAHAVSLGASLEQVQDEKPKHRVSVRQFWLSKTEVTRGQFRAFTDDTGYRPGHFCWGFSQQKRFSFVSSGDWRKPPGFEQESDEHPVVCVTWYDAQAYVKWLSRKTGKNYRLPSEAEWEYAARAGTTTSRYWGQDNEDACNHANVSNRRAAKFSGKNATVDRVGEMFLCSDPYVFTAPVAQFKPNSFGLYDMLGNVEELTDDYYKKSYTGAPIDGSVWKEGSLSSRVVRGGGWGSGAWLIRSANRGWYHATLRNSLVGFRVARTE
jgi:sulfatase modifying factor 1